MLSSSSGLGRKSITAVEQNQYSFITLSLISDARLSYCKKEAAVFKAVQEKTFCIGEPHFRVITGFFSYENNYRDFFSISNAPFKHQ